MELLPKQLRKEEFEYYSDKSVKAFRIEMEQLFEKTYGLNFSINLVGEFVSEDEFKITPKWQFIIIRHFERDAAYLNGKIISQGKNSTLVKFSVRPNSIFVIFFFVFPVISVALLISYFNGDSGKTDMLVVIAVFGIVTPLVSMLIARSVKNGIKQTFVTTFNLQPIQKPTNH